MSERKELLERFGVYNRTIITPGPTGHSLANGKIIPLRVGGPRNVRILYLTLKVFGYRVSERAKNLMQRDSFFPALRKQATNIMILSVSDLGFKEGAEFRQICSTAVGLGLWLCPAQIGFMLRVGYDNQPKHERVRIAMRTIQFSHNGGIFYGILIVSRDTDGFCLDADEVHLDDFFAAEDLFAFVRPPGHTLLQS